MPPLIPFGFEAAAPDAVGNSHVRADHRGRTVLRDPGDYRGRHRAVAPPNRWQMLLAWAFGEDV